MAVDPEPPDHSEALAEFARWAATDEAAAHADELIAMALKGSDEMRRMHEVDPAILRQPMTPWST